MLLGTDGITDLFILGDLAKYKCNGASSCFSFLCSAGRTLACPCFEAGQETLPDDCTAVVSYSNTSSSRDRH